MKMVVSIIGIIGTVLLAIYVFKINLYFVQSLAFTDEERTNATFLSYGLGFLGLATITMSGFRYVEKDPRWILGLIIAIPLMVIETGNSFGSLVSQSKHTEEHSTAAVLEQERRDLSKKTLDFSSASKIDNVQLSRDIAKADEDIAKADFAIGKCKSNEKTCKKNARLQKSIIEAKKRGFERLLGERDKDIGRIESVASGLKINEDTEMDKVNPAFRQLATLFGKGKAGTKQIQAWQFGLIAFFSVFTAHIGLWFFVVDFGTEKRKITEKGFFNEMTNDDDGFDERVHESPFSTKKFSEGFSKGGNRY